MPPEKPTPITPEGKRAAERVRTIFYSIAAANLVIVAIIIWLGKGRKDPAKPVPVEIGAPLKNNAIPAPADRNEKP